MSSLNQLRPIPSLIGVGLTFFMTFNLSVSMYGCDQGKQQVKQSEAPAQMSIEAKANVLITQAWSEESTVTPLLKELATRFKGQLRGLEHRLKTHSSTIRKLKKILSENPTLTPNDATINDALRYTIEVKDEPPGNYVQTIHEVLKHLESKGHTVLKVKNTWPKGDNYSGVNTALQTPKDTLWELQFHTPESYKIQKDSHDLYKQLRSIDTPKKKKKVLFQKMAHPYEALPIPKDVLIEKNLHKIEEIKRYPSP